MKQFLMAALLVVVAVSGCIDNSDDPDTPGGTESTTQMVAVAPDQTIFEGTILNDHALGATGHVGHTLPELHEGSEGLSLLSMTTMSDGIVGYGSAFAEVDVVGDLALVSSIFGSRGVTILNVSDPSNMVTLSHIYNMDDNWDARFSLDGLYLFLGCQGSGAFDCTTISVNGEEELINGGLVCASIATCPGGIAVFDIGDPTNPSFVSYLEMGFTHNVFTFMVDDKHYVMNEGGTIGEFDPATREFEVISNAIDASRHDIAAQVHPITGQTLLYTGNGGGMVIWDVSNPFEPALIGAIESGGDVPPMWHEQTPMPCLLDGRHITIGAGESGSGVPDHIAVVDTTDPTTPIYLGKWVLPDAASITAQQNYRFSLHNIDGNCQGQVAIGHYHAGVWVFDVSTEERQAAPVTLGYYQPHERVVEPSYSPVMTAPIGAVITLDTPNVWAAMWSDDGETLFIPDMTTGLYALAPTWDYEPIS
ncbi:MAG: LVIVD repeat-containing protein [Thermoplasmatota archaeon]